ncbi:MAG: trypsin-like peptidase domain-containing protein, partial [Simkania negevensis]|nr:trypsin-like peptidase domain-containing protein [Simkania negevensis]
YRMPWNPPAQESVTGTGVVIEGNQILTCAHVIANAVLIRVELEGSVGLYEARVKCVGHDCDLALLEVEEGFFNEVPILEISDKPVRRQEKVELFGYPVGGAGLSITKGIISRVEVGTYTHRKTKLLYAQIDAATNPGNSGGPVIGNQKVIGIAFQGFSYGESINYMVPTTIIHRFLKEAKEKNYEGFPQIGFSYQEMANKQLRDFYQMGSEDSGVLITKINHSSPFYKHLFLGDILLKVGGFSISNEGKIEVPFLEKLSFIHVVSMMFYGDELSLEVLREGKRFVASLRLDKDRKGGGLPSLIQFEQPPTYYILGGVVFQPLTWNLFHAKAERGGYFHRIEEGMPKISRIFFHYLSQEGSDLEKKEIIVISQVLRDRLNTTYEALVGEIVEKVNGKTVRDMRHFVELTENCPDPFLQIITENGKVILFDLAQLRAREITILQNYAVPSSASKDLRI